MVFFMVFSLLSYFAAHLNSMLGYHQMSTGDSIDL